MTQLAELQQAFQRCLLDTTDDALPPWVSASGRAAPDVQLSVYIHAYRGRLTEVLANDFPAMVMALGDEDFATLAHGYIDAHPSRYFSLREFGRDLAGFIQQQPHYEDRPWLNELAHFEWALGQAFDVADVVPLSEHDLTTIPAEDWPGLRFDIHPSVQRLDLCWNIVAIWQSLTADTPTEASAISGEVVPWLVWRQQLTTQFRSLEKDEQLALDALAEGACFDEMCELLSTVIPIEAVPLRAAELLKGWIGQGLLSGIK